jgi:HSP20 family molecular chaperone IbpA
MSKNVSKKRAKKEKPSMAPTLYMDHDEKNYYIQVELLGVKKEDVTLEVSDQSLCVRGSRTDLEFSGCYILTHIVDTSKARAKFDNGLLSVEIPIKKILAGKKVAIE